MITYELAMLLKVLPKGETAEVLKRTASGIFEKGGVIREILNMGTRETPRKISSHGIVHRQASYFVLSFTAPPKSVDGVQRECRRDVDVITSRIYKQVEPDAHVCTIEEEMRPPPYRPEVIKMIEDAKRRKEWQDRIKRKFKYNSGMDYYPFQK